MKITQLRLNEFKIFKEAELNFAPLTLLTGANSSGKSAVINALAAVMQTKQPHQFPFEVSPNGKNCALGSFRDIVKGRNSKNSFKIGLTLQDGKQLYKVDGEFRYSSSGNQILPKRVFYKDDDHQFELKWVVKEARYEAKIDSTEPIQDWYRQSMVATMEWMKKIDSARPVKSKKDADKDIDQKDLEDYLNNLSKVGEWFNLKSKKPLDLIEEISDEATFGKYIIKSLSRTMRQLSMNSAYIGPVRAYPSRYYQPEDSGVMIDPLGQNAIAHLCEWKKHYRSRFREVISLMEKLKLASNVSPKSSVNEILRLNIQPFKHTADFSIADVGFGISQVLPIIIADVSLAKGGNLLVNQPEVHLHPSSQALLGDYFASRLDIRNYIIETHSEYLINRLRLLVANGEIEASDVSIIYIDAPDTEDGNPKIYNIGIGKDGSLDNAPSSFFETYYQDTFKLAMSGFEGEQ